MLHDLCCDALARAVQNEDISAVATGGDRVAFWIYGRPQQANDGDGYMNDMTQEHEIYFCPFCGRKL